MMKKFFLKRFAHILRIFMIPAVVLFIFIFFMLSYSTVVTLDEQICTSAQDISDDMDTLLTQCFSQQDMLTLNVQMSVAMKKALASNASTYTEYIFINSINTFFSSITSSNPLIHTIYLYLDGYDAFLSSVRPLALIATDSDQTWYQYYEQMPAEASTYAISRTIPWDNSSRSVQVLTLYHRLSYLKGVLVANVPYKELQANLQNLLPDEQSSLYLTDTNGQQLLSININDATDIQQIPSIAADSPIWVKLDGHYYRAYSGQIEDFSLGYIILTPLSVVVARILGQLFWPAIMLLVIFILILFLAYTNTRDNFRQIQHVIDVFANAEHGIYPSDTRVTDIDNEYDLIMNNVISVFLNTTFLNSQLHTAELEALQLQINPHFMINTLQTVNFELYKLTDRPTALSNILNNLSDILNYSLRQDDSPVTLGDELTYIRKYIEIQKYRFPDSFIYYEDVDETTESLPFRRLLLQPLIENSISHGLRDLELDRKGLIKLKIFTRNNVLHVYVMDNGKGMSKERMAEIRAQLDNDTANRIGLNNVNKRLILSFGPTSGLVLQSKKGYGTIISFHIPL